MSPTTDLLQRLDTLIHRKRVFVANVGQLPPALDEPPGEDEDIPVLTEVVEISEVTGDTPHDAVHPGLDPLADSINQAFSLQLQERFAAELPGLIEGACQRLAIELQQTVHRLTDETLREFASQRRQLSLALDEQSGKKAP
jgi:hypothetical protein